jgi:membrane-bound ClpP family serine protease
VERTRRFVRRALDKARTEKARLILILQFDVPGDQLEFGRGSEFGASVSLAEFLSSEELGGARTVAYVPEPIQGHAVLVALACDEIIMARNASLGPAGVDDSVISAARRTHYREIANRRKTVPAAVALWLLDPAQEVFVAETEASREFVTPEELKELEKRHKLKSVRKLFDPKAAEDSLVGDAGRLTGEEGRRFGFVSYLANTREEMAKALDLPPNAVEEDLALVDEWRPVRVDLKGPINDGKAASIERLLEDQVRQGANFICLWVNSPGGSINESIRLANMLARYEPNKVRTVAYVPAEARADAAMVALACHQVIMHPRAVLGGPGAREFTRDDVRNAVVAIRDEHGPWRRRSWSLVAALIDPALPVYACARPGEVAYFSQEELDEYHRKHPEAKRWRRGEQVTITGKVLQIDGETAAKYGLAERTVESFTEFKQYFGLEGDPTLLESGWADFLIDALASPGVAVLLLLIGFVALYVELHTPGIGVGGFVAMLCFVIFFWSQYLGGTAGWLEALLFVAGICCLLLEFFVIPGFGIFGLGGGALVLISLILASQTFVFPHNAYQFAQMQRSLLTVAGAGVGCFMVAMLLQRWLPKAPVLGHVFLPPPQGAEAEAISRREALVDFGDLLGARGVTTTQLTPCGKARFGDRLVDVITDGDLVPRGTEIEVVEVHGNRVVVKPIGEL